MHNIAFFFRQVRQNLGCNLCKIGAERKKKNGSCNIKDGVHVCNLCCNVVRSQTLYKGSKWGQDANDGEDGGTDDVEEKMDDSGSLRIACSTNRSQNCCDTGTDVLTKQNIYCLRKSDYTASCKCLKDTNRSRRGLDDSGEQCTSKDAQYRVGELGHQVDEGLGITQRHHRGAHHIHTDKQNTQTGNDFTVVMNLFLLDKDDERNSR